MVFETAKSWIERHPIWTSLGSSVAVMPVLAFISKQTVLDLVFGTISDWIKTGLSAVVGEQFLSIATQVVGYLLAIIVVSFVLYLFFQAGRKTEGRANIRGKADGSPDLPIRELYLHIDPQVLEDDNPNNRSPWIKVGSEILTRLSTGQLRAWGEMDGLETPRLVLIPQGFWETAEFTDMFFPEGEQHQQLIHAQSQKREGRVGYRNIRFSKAEIEAVWPRSADSSKDTINTKPLIAARNLVALIVVFVVALLVFGASMLPKVQEPQIQLPSINEAYWPPLSAEESAALTEKLRPIVSTKMILTCSQMECRELARSVLAAFKNAGWTDIQLVAGGLEAVGVEGVQLTPGDGPAKELREIIESTTDLSVKIIDVDRNFIELPAYTLAIGSKPF